MLALACTPSVGGGCGGTPDASWAGLTQILAPLEAYGLRPSPTPDVLAQLAWQAPDEACEQVYRLRISYAPAQLNETDSVSTLAIGRVPPTVRTQKADVDVPEHAPIPAEVVAPLRLFYRGLRAEKRGSTRDIYATAQQYGPSAPIAACFPRTWDPMEDALALGWPQLPDHAVMVGERWIGGRVAGKCSRAPCVDPNTGGGGEQQHHRACVSMSWQERLAGVYELGGERYALVESHWDDGHGLVAMHALVLLAVHFLGGGAAQSYASLDDALLALHDSGVLNQGISTDRTTLVSLDHGRPLWSRTTVNHRYPQPTTERTFAPVVRTWVLESADACRGSLASLGWQRPEGELAEVTDAIEQLRNTDELRKRESKSKREADPQPAADPFAAAGPPP